MREGEIPAWPSSRVFPKTMSFIRGPTSFTSHFPHVPWAKFEALSWVSGALIQVLLISGVNEDAQLGGRAERAAQTHVLDFEPITGKFSEPAVLEQGVLKRPRAPGNPQPHV